MTGSGEDEKEGGQGGRERKREGSKKKAQCEIMMKRKSAKRTYRREREGGREKGKEVGEGRTCVLSMRSG